MPTSGSTIVRNKRVTIKECVETTQYRMTTVKRVRCRNNESNSVELGSIKLSMRSRISSVGIAQMKLVCSRYHGAVRGRHQQYKCLLVFTSVGRSLMRCLVRRKVVNRGSTVASFKPGRVSDRDAKGVSDGVMGSSKQNIYLYIHDRRWLYIYTQANGSDFLDSYGKLTCREV